ncbi:hypothetical protein OUZ56_031319 [Daphnia magna]|uniref:Uncharacterized protein n=1 Tax=Daphnia magna TaxID=35525 RepID=A0ABQ9ZTW8_9CRUS|nr:hypothetical protein OUZ56_031319 [Daphnia magna]
MINHQKEAKTEMDEQQVKRCTWSISDRLDDEVRLNHGAKRVSWRKRCHFGCSRMKRGSWTNIDHGK